MDEFELIERYFAHMPVDSTVDVPIGDDGAVVTPAAGRRLVAVVDTLVEGVHFPQGFAADDLGFRAVQVNLSDIAAMGARPRWMTLALTLSASDAGWLSRFATGLRAAAEPLGLALIGGDTTRGSQIVVSVQILGDVEPGAAVRRSGAVPGDAIFVSGWPGEAAAGLELLQSGIPRGEAARLIERFRRPQARVALGQRLGGLASAAIDVSDGLASDLAKLLQASGCAGEIDVATLPLSADLVAAVGPGRAEDFVLQGGDDYELCFTAPPERAAAVAALAADSGLALTQIGIATSGAGLVARRDGDRVRIATEGYRHFAAGTDDA